MRIELEIIRHSEELISVKEIHSNPIGLDRLIASLSSNGNQTRSIYLSGYRRAEGSLQDIVSSIASISDEILYEKNDGHTILLRLEDSEVDTAQLENVLACYEYWFIPILERSNEGDELLIEWVRYQLDMEFLFARFSKLMVVYQSFERDVLWIRFKGVELSTILNTLNCFEG